jgi:acetyl esterase/lipase
MKTLRTKPMLKQIAIWLSTACVCGLFLLFAMQFPSSSLAQTPTPTCTVTPTPTPTATVTPTICPPCPPTPTPYPPSFDHPFTPVSSQFQPPDRGNILGWRAYTPTPAPSASPPGVMVIHGGGWSEGDPFEGGSTMAAADLAAGGYYVVIVNYELAPCGLIPGQPCHETDPSPPNDIGYWVKRQTDEIKSLVKALRADPHCNGKVGIVGSSAGATLAVSVAVDTTSSGNVWPFWTAQNRPDCAIMLSATYDFSDRTPPFGQNQVDPRFLRGVENFTRTGNLTTQKQLSPVSLVTIPTTEVPFKPLSLINSEGDSPPAYHQIVDMICALKAAPVPDTAYETFTIPHSSEHAFQYWKSWDKQPCVGPCKTISSHVTEFLDTQLK